MLVVLFTENTHITMPVFFVYFLLHKSVWNNAILQVTQLALAGTKSKRAVSDTQTQLAQPLPTYKTLILIQLFFFLAETV